MESSTRPIFLSHKEIPMTAKRQKTGFNKATKAADLKVVFYKTPMDERSFVLKWTATSPYPYYRSRESLVSKFCWVRIIAAAARFPSRKAANECARDYMEQIDSVRTYSGLSPNPSDVIYGPREAREHSSSVKYRVTI